MGHEKESVSDEKHHQIKQYRCFCTKNYNSYAGLYLHLKSKHEDAFSLYKNMKISKLLTPVLSEPSKVIFKLKELSKQQNDGNQSSSQKLSNLKGKSLKSEELRPLIRDQPFFYYRQQSAPYTPTSYYSTFPSHLPYAISNQPYFSNPQREFSVSNQPLEYGLAQSYNYYQYLVPVKTHEQPLIYEYPSQPAPNSCFVSNGLQYWVGVPQHQESSAQKLVERQQNLKNKGNDFITLGKVSEDKTAKQKSRKQEKNSKFQGKNTLNSLEESTRKPIDKNNKLTSSQKTKTQEVQQS